MGAKAALSSDPGSEKVGSGPAFVILEKAASSAHQLRAVAGEAIGP